MLYSFLFDVSKWSTCPQLRRKVVVLLCSATYADDRWIFIEEIVPLQQKL